MADVRHTSTATETYRVDAYEKVAGKAVYITDVAVKGMACAIANFKSQMANLKFEICHLRFRPQRTRVVLMALPHLSARAQPVRPLPEGSFPEEPVFEAGMLNNLG